MVGVMEGTFSQPMSIGNGKTIPPTGKKVSLDGVTLVRMSNGKIAEERDFFDNLDFMTQLGLMPAAQ